MRLFRYLRRALFGFGVFVRGPLLHWQFDFWFSAVNAAAPAASRVFLIGFLESFDRRRQMFVQKVQDLLIILSHAAVLKFLSSGHADSANQRGSMIDGLLFGIHLRSLTDASLKRTGPLVPIHAGGNL